jgi:hypothetical protein
MNPYENALIPPTAASATDVSHAVVLVLCVGFMLAPFAILAGLVYSGIRRRRLTRGAAARPSSREGRP